MARELSPNRQSQLPVHRLSLARRLRQLKRASGKTNAEIAREMGCGITTAARWFSGEAAPEFDQWPKLAAVLGLSDYRKLLL